MTVYDRQRNHSGIVTAHIPLAKACPMAKATVAVVRVPSIDLGRRRGMKPCEQQSKFLDGLKPICKSRGSTSPSQGLL